ncbi:hypothetical protein [Quadrisphaera sp. DSM 44207]|uniref:hypothetical protein n=1 Tax=Quadrisphaera sp. DSM 44207 TaxID=1881057 RepID=UPI0008800833|nr:hypothetical protein [Quadrisphaera sp. DSM 44207]SDQ06861.1 hypothetical protein SAMN05428996_0330 [Quadrisphaera sp. DSM 44207]
MSAPRRSAGSTPTGVGGAWHAGPALLAAYAAGRAGEVDAWSLEAHLTSCALCRAELAAALHAAPAGRARALVEHGRQRLLADLTPPRGARPGLFRTVPSARPAPGLPRRPWTRRLRGRAAWLVRPAALVAVAVALVVAVGVATAVRLAAPAGPPGAALLWLLAPALPLAGVALCSAGEDDPWREVVLSTPSAGLRLVLWRTAAVLAVTVPLALLAGAALGGAGATADGRSEPVVWLLPCLALTATTLAAGTLVALERAAAGVAALWGLAVLAPAVATAGADARGVVGELARAAASPGGVPLVAGAGAQASWALVAVAATAVVVVRGASYERLPRAARRRNP